MIPHLVGFAEIGIYLRDRRESYGIDATQAARALRFKTAYITALEAGDLEALPGFAYARGYLSSYADYLGLDKPMLLRAFDEAGSFRPQKLFQPEPMRHGARPGLGLLLIVALLLVAVVAGRRVMTQYFGLPASHAAPAPDGAEDAGPVAAPARIAPSSPPPPANRSRQPCLMILPRAEDPPFCHGLGLPRRKLGMQPRIRYSSELQLPTYLIRLPQ